MAQWKETLEPYVKVIESVKTAALNPSAGTDLIVGAVIMSDRGPSEPTLIQGQRQFLETYAAQDLSKDYTDSLDELYTGDNASLASTMWLNAYRLAGSGNLLVARAGKVNGLAYVKPLDTKTSGDFIIRDGEMLKAVSPFKFVIDDGTVSSGEVTSANDGWAISIRDIGIFGNRVTDDGPLYNYYCDNLYDLVDKLNETTKFYITDYEFYSDVKCQNLVDDPEMHKAEIKAVLFKTIYLASGGVMEPEVIDAVGNVQYWGYDSTGKTKNKWGDTDSKTGTSDIDSTAVGCAYIIPAAPDWESGAQNIIDLNSKEYSGFEAIPYYAENVYNSRVDLKVRIRRFNHNAVQNIQTEEGSTDSPYKVIQSVLDVYTKKGTKKPAESVLHYDFYEFCIYDPAVSKDPQLFNVGNVGGRGDITIADLNDNLSSLHLSLPQDLGDLGLNYYDYSQDDYCWKALEDIPEGAEVAHTYSSIGDLPTTGNTPGEVVAVTVDEDTAIYYQWAVSGNAEIDLNVKIGNSDASKSLLRATNADIMKAWDRIELDERYIVEGLTDCGCTEPMIQNYIANIATNSNFFYPASTIASTNYMVVANKKSKVTKANSKVYWLAPFDLDDGTVGYLFNAMSSTLYWEVVFANRRNNQEFAAAFGQNHGVTSVVNLAKEFNKSERQLLLAKNINTIFRDLYLERIYINDNKTAQVEENVMSEENNSRLMIRISKAMPVLLNQFKGYQANSKTWTEAKEVIEQWFKTVVLAYGTTIAEFKVTIDESNNTDADMRASKMNVLVQVRFFNSVKYITVYNEAFPVGVEFGEE